MNRPVHPATAMNPALLGGGAGHGHGSRAEKESSCGPTTLFDRVLERDNLLLAWKQVKGNRGAPGVDGMDIGAFPGFIREHWEKIQAKLRAGSYRPSPVKRVFIPKPNGSQRALGIPTVLDRVIQQAIAQVLPPLYEPTFSDSSHGFRPGRSAHGAVDQMLEEGVRRGKSCHVVDCDLQSFFDTVDHRKMMDRLRQRIPDDRLLGLVAAFLKAGAILPDGTFEETRTGVPQGGPLSPLLANILLDEFDHELETRGHSFVRYADDFIIFCASPRAGRRILEGVKRYLQKRLKLVVNEAKSKVVKLREATFLGFRIFQRRVCWSEKSRLRFKETVRVITGRTRGVSPVRVIEDLNRYVRGALNYYAIGIPWRDVLELDGWVRRRMRLYYWKQWGRPRARRRNLLRLGTPRDIVHMASRSRKGMWRMSHNTIVQRAMTDGWLAEQGVPSLKEQWKAIRYPVGPSPEIS